MNKVIGSVKPNVRTWSGSYGPMESVDGTFQDGEGWSINCKQGNGEKTKAELSALIGKPLEGYTVEAKMKDGQQQEYQGRLQWNLKKQQQQAGGRSFGGGGGGFKESYAYSKERCEQQDWSIISQVALKCAVETSIAQKLFSDETVIERARHYRDFLAEPRSGTVAPNEGDAFKDFMAGLKAVNAERKAAGKGPADATCLAEAIRLRGWDIEGFRNWTEFQELLGPKRFSRLNKAMDANPLAFEKEITREEEA